MCKGGHCLGTPQACTCVLGVGISIAIKIVGHFLFEEGRLWDHPVWSWLHTVTLPWHKEQKWTMGGDFKFSMSFKILEHLWFKGHGTIPYDHGQHTIKCSLTQGTRIYSETSQNRPALGPNNMAGLEEWPVLWDFLCKEMFGRDLNNWPVFREGQV
jgi:hypothetical protein